MYIGTRDADFSPRSEFFEKRLISLIEMEDFKSVNIASPPPLFSFLSLNANTKSDLSKAH